MSDIHSSEKHSCCGKHSCECDNIRMHTNCTTLEALITLRKKFVLNPTLKATLILDIDLTLINHTKKIYEGVLEAYTTLLSYLGITVVFYTSRCCGWSPSAYNPEDRDISEFEHVVFQTVNDIKPFLRILGVSTNQAFKNCKFEKIFLVEVEGVDVMKSTWMPESCPIGFSSAYKGNAIGATFNELEIDMNELVIIIDDNPMTIENYNTQFKKMGANVDIYHVDNSQVEFDKDQTE